MRTNKYLFTFSEREKIGTVPQSMTERRKQVPQKLRGWLRNIPPGELPLKRIKAALCFQLQEQMQCSFLKYLFHIGYRKWNLYKSWPSLDTLIDIWLSSLSWGERAYFSTLLSLPGQRCFSVLFTLVFQVPRRVLACCCLLELKLFIYHFI